jgi:hypothetical protein
MCLYIKLLRMALITLSYNQLECMGTMGASARLLLDEILGVQLIFYTSGIQTVLQLHNTACKPTKQSEKSH